MTSGEFLQLRLASQQISDSSFTRPEQVVQWMVGMQAQEYLLTKWSVGLRLPESTDSTIENAFNEGRILRTHVMRPTWHFVTPADIRWLLQLTAPRVHAANAFMYRKLELDKKILHKSNEVIQKLLEGGKQVTRSSIQNVLNKKKLNASGLRLGYMLMYAELEGLICSGPRVGKQFTYMLLEERAAPVKKISRDKALVQFAERYFRSRGPATIQDFAYWSGLTIKDATEGTASLPTAFLRERINGKDYHFYPDQMPVTNGQDSFLMPDYDEYGMSYKDKSAIFGKQPPVHDQSSATFNRMIIINGRIAGTWKRTVEGNSISLTASTAPLSKGKQKLLSEAINKFTLFYQH